MQSKPTYNYKRPSGPRGTKDKRSNQFSVTMEQDEAELIRELVGDSGLSGFFRLGALLLGAILYEDEKVDKMALVALEDTVSTSMWHKIVHHLNNLSVDMFDES